MIHAPGWPGLPARWTSSAKSGVGTSLGNASVWFTISHGILNEIYYPRVDRACTRDQGFVVTAGAEFFSEEKRAAQHTISPLVDGIPAFRLTSLCNEGRYRIDKEILVDPTRDVLLQRVKFTPLVGTLGDYHLYALLAPHLGNGGAQNNAARSAFKGVPMLFAKRDNIALALACSTHWLQRSVGFIGVSDGWNDLATNKRLTVTYDSAKNGNVGLIGEIDLLACAGEFSIAIGFGHTHGEAGHRALASLWDGYDAAHAQYVAEWSRWQQQLLPLQSVGRDLYRASTAILRTHESSHFPGGIVASLSVPWGSSKGDGDLGGYHLAWPRDLVESAGGLLAAGAHEDARRVLRYLAVTQEAAGNWPQNMWLDGTAYWHGVQMDETGFPILLVDLAKREGCVDRVLLAKLWPMVRRAASYLVQNGPVTQQDRWEEDAGYSPFTLAVEVAALLVAADLAEDAKEPSVATYLRETADAWNSAIERWTFARDTKLSKQFGVSGYYVRIAPEDHAEASSPLGGFVPIKNRPPGAGDQTTVSIVSPDALALVRFGLRAANDPRVLDTLKVIDGLLRVEAPQGPCWHRYNEDGYGEHEDGTPFDGSGIGRPWPLLTGERAHYALAGGQRAEAERLTTTFASFANSGGILPEQIWDAPDRPQQELFFGKPSGSAMPLVWAHAEYIKLCRSLRDNRVFDMPPQTVKRYQVDNVVSLRTSWRFNHKCAVMSFGQTLRVETLAPATVHWSVDGWNTAHDSVTQDTTLGTHYVDLPTADLRVDGVVQFTFRWASRWEGSDFSVRITEDKS